MITASFRGTTIKSKHLANTMILLVNALFLGVCATIPAEVSPTPDSKVIDSGESKAAPAPVVKKRAPAFTIRNLYDPTGSGTVKK